MNSKNLDKLTFPLASIYEKLEQELMLSIARRIRDYNDTSGTIEWELKMLAEMGSLKRENVGTLTKVLADGDERLQRLLKETAELALADVEPLLSHSGAIKPPLPVEASTRLQQVYNSYYNHAVDKLSLTNTTMLNSAEQAYRDIINKTTLKVASGQTTRVEALRQTIKEFAEKGLPALVDKGGHEWSPQTYVNMVLRTTVHNIDRETRFARMDDWGEDLFQVSQHAGARLLCAPYQGIVVSKANRNGIVEDLNGTKVRYIPLSSTSYGEPAGLFGINCDHRPELFIPSISVLRSKVDMSDNEKVYNESQAQRRLERRIRKIKGEINIYKQSDQQELLQDAYSHLSDANIQMKEFIAKTGRTRRSDREQIYLKYG